VLVCRLVKSRGYFFVCVESDECAWIAGVCWLMRDDRHPKKQPAVTTLEVKPVLTINSGIGTFCLFSKVVRRFWIEMGDFREQLFPTYTVSAAFVTAHFSSQKGREGG
jgi:hypothetical protein